MNTEEQTTPFAQKKVRPLTRKQQAFVTYILEHPLESDTAAARHAYPSATKRTQEQIAHENMKKPEILMALGKANDTVESVLTTVVEEWGTSDDVKERTLAVNTAEWIHDKIHGKATQKIQQSTSVITLSLDLTGGSAGAVPQHVIDSLQ